MRAAHRPCWRPSLVLALSPVATAGVRVVEQRRPRDDGGARRRRARRPGRRARPSPARARSTRSSPAASRARSSAARPTGRPKLDARRERCRPTSSSRSRRPGARRTTCSYPIAVIGSGASGVLTSDSTRIVGLVSLADVANGDLRWVAVDDPVATLERLDRRIERNDRIRLPITIALVFLAAIVGWLAPRCGRRASRCSRSPPTCGSPAGGWSPSPSSPRSRCRSAPPARRSSSPTSPCSGSIRRRSRCRRSARLRPDASTASRTSSPPGCSSPRCSARRSSAARGSRSPPSRSWPSAATASAPTAAACSCCSPATGRCCCRLSERSAHRGAARRPRRRCRRRRSAALVGLDAALGGSSHVTNALGDGPGAVAGDVARPARALGSGGRREASARRRHARRARGVSWRVATRRPRTPVTDAMLVAVVRLAARERHARPTSRRSERPSSTSSAATRRGSPSLRPVDLDRLRAMRRTTIAASSLLAALALAVAGCTSGEEVGATPRRSRARSRPRPRRMRGPAGPRADGNAATASRCSPPTGAAPATRSSAAGASGNVGPNLDQAKPSYELAVQRLTLGQGGMPRLRRQAHAAGDRGPRPVRRRLDERLSLPTDFPAGVSAFACDLDGTLIRGGGPLGERTRSAIARSRAPGSR